MLDFENGSTIVLRILEPYGGLLDNSIDFVIQNPPFFPPKEVIGPGVHSVH